jgi:hypothetical protein
MASTSCFPLSITLEPGRRDAELFKDHADRIVSPGCGWEKITDFG